MYLQTGQRERGEEILKEYNRNRAVAEDLSRLTLRVAARPDDAQAHREFGGYYLRGGSSARAIVQFKQFKRVLELKPNDAAARRLLAQALTNAGRTAEAKTLVASGPGPARANGFL